MITVPPKKPKRSLQERLDEAANASSVSMLPDTTPRKKKEPEVLPDIREVIADPIARVKILRLARQIHEYGTAEREAKAAKKVLVDKLKPLLDEAGKDAGKFMADTLRVLYYEVPRSSIIKERLLEHNVSPRVIAACTVTKKTSTLKVSMQGEKEEDDE